MTVDRNKWLGHVIRDFYIIWI